MFTRCFACAFAWLLFFSGPAAGQTHGGGGGHGPGATASPAHTNSPTPGSSNSSIPGSVPITSANDEGKIEFRTETILVQVPIVITDKSGKHIHGLTKEDFHVFENGKEQKVATFEEIITTNTKLPVVVSKQGEFANLNAVGSAAAPCYRHRSRYHQHSLS